MITANLLNNPTSPDRRMHLGLLLIRRRDLVCCSPFKNISVANCYPWKHIVLLLELTTSKYFFQPKQQVEDEKCEDRQRQTKRCWSMDWTQVLPFDLISGGIPALPSTSRPSDGKVFPDEDLDRFKKKKVWWWKARGINCMWTAAVWFHTYRTYPSACNKCSALTDLARVPATSTYEFKMRGKSCATIRNPTNSCGKHSLSILQHAASNCYRLSARHTVFFLCYLFLGRKKGIDPPKNKRPQFSFDWSYHRTQISECSWPSLSPIS